MVDFGSCSYILGSNSPIVQNPANSLEFIDGLPRFKAQSKTIKEIDNGKIDILLLDCEGAEWFVLENLISRPYAISIELFDGQYYKNPNLYKILEWLKENNYEQAANKGTDILFLEKEMMKFSKRDKNFRL